MSGMWRPEQEWCTHLSWRMEFRDSFMRHQTTPVDPRSYGQWLVCEKCGFEKPAVERAGGTNEPGGAA